MSRWWIRYCAHLTPDNGTRDDWPEGMQSWCTGERSDGVPVHCALVDVDGEYSDARDLVESCFHAVQIESVSPKPDSWLPGDRFPG